MLKTLSAAEIKTLQSPETEQVKIILPLLLKELVLNGWVKVQKGKILISLTALGIQKLENFGADSPFLVGILNTIALARTEDSDNCTNPEWRKQLSQKYPDNASFTKIVCLFHWRTRV